MQPAPENLPPLIGSSPAFLDLMEQVSRAAPLDRPVLIVGERGTGKELIATRLHYLSPRWNAPLVKLNAAAIPPTLLESELFGHEAGAFTGAVRRRAGRFEQAEGGSLVLDEVALADFPVQEQLLRVVEYGTFERIGGAATLAVDVRLIAATNLDLPSEAAAGRFRHDLLDRLAFDVLTVPPLRHRREDIPELAEHYGRNMALELGWHGFPGFARTALEAMADHAWPGNVRELRNVAERAVYRWPHPTRPIARLQLDPFDSPHRPVPAASSRPSAAPTEPPGEGDLRSRVAAFERRLLEEALEAARHNRRLAAARLGLSYDQLRHTLKRHGLMARDDAGTDARTRAGA